MDMTGFFFRFFKSANCCAFPKSPLESVFDSQLDLAIQSASPDPLDRNNKTKRDKLKKWCFFAIWVVKWMTESLNRQTVAIELNLVLRERENTWWSMVCHPALGHYVLYIEFHVQVSLAYFHRLENSSLFQKNEKCTCCWSQWISSCLIDSLRGNWRVPCLSCLWQFLWIASFPDQAAFIWNKQSTVFWNPIIPYVHPILSYVLKSYPTVYPILSYVLKPYPTVYPIPSYVLKSYPISSIKSCGKVLPLSLTLTHTHSAIWLSQPDIVTTGIMFLRISAWHLLKSSLS